MQSLNNPISAERHGRELEGGVAEHARMQVPGEQALSAQALC